jgi:GT2 family glycosyltransferase
VHSVLSEVNRFEAENIVQVVIVDNGSREIYLEQLKSWVDESNHPCVRLIQNPSNVGFSAGMNSGIRSLKSDPPDFYWLLNNDVTIQPGSLYSLIEAAEQDTHVVIWGPTVIDALSGKIQCAGGCRYLKWTGRDVPYLEGQELGKLPLDTRVEFDYIYGAAMFLRSDFLLNSGGLDESYFLFFEELELARKVTGRMSLGWCANSVVFHFGSKSTVNDRDARARAAYFAALSAYRFTLRHYPLCIVTVVSSRILGVALYALKEKNAGLFFAPLKALFTFIKLALNSSS